jgi:mediator of RNA polymerase II transcription subunit 6
MIGIEYVLSEVMEPHLFIMKKQKRDSPDKVTPMLAYYILDGSIYQAPQLSNVFAARIVCSISFLLPSFLILFNKPYVDRTLTHRH